jgi:superkiller protein 3
MGRAFILQAASKWEEAASVFEKVSSLLPDDMDVGLRAREECAWCRCQLGSFEECLTELQLVLDSLNDFGGEELNHDRAQCLWRLGKCYLEIGGMFLFNRLNLRLHIQLYRFEH